MINRMIRRSVGFCLIFLLSCFLHAGFAQNAEIATNPEAVYNDPTGVEVRFNDDGTMKSILSRAEAELVFGDRKDVRQALKKATMRAKADIAKFMTESIKSNDVLREMTETASEGKSGEAISSVRTTLETQVETIESSANAILTGVVTLAQDINREEKYVKVTLGVKEQTINAASKLNNQINTGVNGGQKNNNSNNLKQGNTTEKEREVRKSKMYDDF
jgi:hypothetical protein